jgi:hypothetical protein
VFRIKREGQNNFSANHCGNSAISGLFKISPVQIRMYRFQQSIYCRKVAADPFLVLVRGSPFRFVIRAPWDNKRSAGFDFISLKPKNVCCSRIRQIGRLLDCLDAFTAIKSPGMRCRWSLFLRPSTEIGPGVTVWVFSA